MAKSQAHFRLEESLLQAIKAKAEEQKITVTDLVTKFLKQGLGIDTQEDIQSVNTQKVEDAVYQRISERISHDITELENRISIRVTESIAELNNYWEKRISECISQESQKLLETSTKEEIKCVPQDDISNITSETEKPNSNNSVSSEYTEDTQKENKEADYLKYLLLGESKDLIVRTKDVPLLPGLENKDPGEIKTILRNAKIQNKMPVRIEGYLFNISGKEAGLKGSLLWKVLEKPS